MSTESDLVETRLSVMLWLGGPFPGGAVPIKPLRVGTRGLGGTWRGGMFEEFFGSPGDVGGRASRAELTECALRLCVERGAAATCAWGERVLVILMVTERGSPAKYEDCDGVTTIRRAVSATCSSEDIILLKADAGKARCTRVATKTYIL
jgi:hypothetical protein